MSDDDDVPETPKQKAKSPAEVVLAALKKLVRPSSPEEIAAKTGLDVKVVQRTLGRLVAVKEAKRAGGDRFTASRHGSR